MHFSVTPAIFQKYPHLLVGLVVCNDVTNGQSPAKIKALLREAEAVVRSRFSDPEALKNHPTIAAWQEAHRTFGSNPNKYLSSIHALCKRVVKGGELPSINALVDLYNVVSLRHMLPVGGEDLDTCSGDIVLTTADGSETFIPLGSTDNEPPEQGEILYRDNVGGICRKWNWREAARTCLTEKTHNAVLVIEAIPPTTRELLDAALTDLEALVRTHCGGTVRREILESSRPSIGL